MGELNLFRNLLNPQSESGKKLNDLIPNQRHGCGSQSPSINAEVTSEKIRAGIKAAIAAALKNGIAEFEAELAKA